MGYCTDEEYRRFMRQCPLVEQMLVDDGIHLRKYWFSVSDEMQIKRFKSRLDDPLRQWKLSPMDLKSYSRWYDYSRARDAMFLASDTAWAPWFVAFSDDKKRARLNALRYVLHTLPYPDKDSDRIGLLDPLIVGRAPMLRIGSGAPHQAVCLTRL